MKEREMDIIFPSLMKNLNITMVEEKEKEVQETFREAVPRHFIFKVQGFSQLKKNSIKEYESNEFEAGGHNWKLLLYPNGNKTENGAGHISLYLVLDVVDTSSSLPASGELNAFFRLFLFDQIRDRYLIREDTEGRTRRFHIMKNVWGIPQFVSLAKFSDPSNGYLVDDTCVFGAEVFVPKPTRNIECLSMVTQENFITPMWRLENISETKEQFIQSQNVKAGNLNWYVGLYPKGHKDGKNNSMSIYLCLADLVKDPCLKVYADFKLRLRDQISGKHTEYSEAKHWYNLSSNSWGWHKFIELSKVYDQGKGYLVNDACIVEAEIMILGVVTKLR